MTRWLRVLTAIVLVGGPLAIAPIATATAQAGETITVVNFEYQPDVLTVPLGATVTWQNSSDRPHTVTDRGGQFDTDPIQPGLNGKVTFSTPGVYHVFCRINPARMNGVIIVDAGAAAAPAVRVEALDPALPDETLRYEPPVLRVQAGTTIVFANVGGRPHTLTADDGAFDSGVLPPGPEGGRFAGSNVTFRLTQPGTYNFHCEIHPQQMRGTITVVGEAPSTPGPAPPSNAAKVANVDMVDFAFRDDQVSVAPGGEVFFRNTGDAPHTASLDDEEVDTGEVSPGQTGRFVAPTTPGSYSYRCALHPARMRGVLVVLGQNTDDPSAALASTKAPVYGGGGGPTGGVSTIVLATAVIGGFFGGFGIAGFARTGRARGRRT
ncbi:MAG: cupredoxin domain-containing protein [Acidimicrobiales bacterium]